MKNGSRVWWLAVSALATALFLSPGMRAQTGAAAQSGSSSPAQAEDQGVNSGNYNIHQTIDFGYRADWINGDQNTYDTFVNLGQGVRLFDYSLDMRSINHAGVFFDDLSFSNFGYGGDPNDVSRLRIEKNKWYDFRLLFRRDKNFWDWNLFANPLNPISTSPTLSPTTPVANSPHGEDMVRRMQDYDLTLFPQSKLRFRLGYSRVRNEGPGFFTTDFGTISPFATNYSYTSNAYRAGVDFAVAPRTTLSYDEMLTYYKQDNITVDQNFPFELATGAGTVPVDLGIVWSTAGAIDPCGPGSRNGGGYPFSGTPTSPPLVTNTNCNGFLGYTQAGRPRNYMPRELFRFRSNYFRKFETSGSLGYSNADYGLPDYFDSMSGWTIRTISNGEGTTGFVKNKRVSVDADWEGDYAVTDKLHIVDQFHFLNWRIPTLSNSLVGTLFASAGGGLGSPAAIFDPTTCNVGNSYSAAGCPFHNTSSDPDVSQGLFQNYFAQNVKTNTFEVEYDFSRRFGAHVGYMYENRKLTDASDSNVTDIYFPGGNGGTAANFYLAARGNCAIPTGGTALPDGCTLNPDGSVTFASGPQTESPSTLTINQHAALVGVNARPIDNLRITGDFEFGSSDFAFTRTSPRQLQSYKINVRYTPKPWATLSGAVDIHENRDNVYTVNNLEHGRSYSVQAVLSASPKLSVDFGYTYFDVYTQADVCYTATPSPVGATPCPSSDSPVGLGALAVYTSTDHMAYGGVMWRVVPRVTFNVGFDGNFVRGTAPYFNQPQFATGTATALMLTPISPQQPAGTLNFNYLRPTSSIAVNIYKGFTYETAWAYYGYVIQGAQFPAGLALTATNPAVPPLQLENFNGSTATFSVRYAF